MNLALIGAYWFLIAVFLILSLLFGAFAFARARVSPDATNRIGIVSTVFVPTTLGAGLAIDGHPTWGLILSAAAILFSLWWLHNMAKREP